MRLFNLCVFALAGFAIASSCSATTSADRGNIAFRGAIVEEGCDMQTVPHTLVISCPQNATKPIQRIDLSAIVTAPQSVSLFEKVQMRYLNQQHSMAIIDVAYN